MKKLTVLTMLFTGFIASSYGQLQKTSSYPYDNIKSEPHAITPKDMEKYALIDNSGQPHDYHKLTGNRITFSSYKKQDASLFKIQPSGWSPATYDIKKVTFPKTKNYFTN